MVQAIPEGSKEEEIPIEARILSVIDVVEAMVYHCPYRPALGIDTDMEKIEKNKGTFFDEAVMDVCLIVFRDKGYQLEGS